MVQGGQDPNDRHHGVGGVRHAEAEIQRGIALGHGTSLVLEPAGGLVEGVEPAELRQRSLGAVGVRVAMHELRIARSEGLVIDPETCRRSFRHVVVDHIGDLRQPHHHLEAVGSLDVHGDVELAPLAPDEGHADGAHGITTYRFHLDDLGTEVPQQHGAEGSGQVLAQIEHDDAAQGTHDESSSTIPASTMPSISASEKPAPANTSRLCSPTRG